MFAEFWNTYTVQNIQAEYANDSVDTYRIAMATIIRFGVELGHTQAKSITLLFIYVGVALRNEQSDRMVDVVSECVVNEHYLWTK